MIGSHDAGDNNKMATVTTLLSMPELAVHFGTCLDDELPGFGDQSGLEPVPEQPEPLDSLLENVDVVGPPTPQEPRRIAYM